MSIIKTGGRFTNTAVPKYNSDSCWQQHLQIFQAIMKSNGWMDGTAALQLFAHLDGEALNVALLMPEGEWADWKRLSQGLSDYHNSPNWNGPCEEWSIVGDERSACEHHEDGGPFYEYGSPNFNGDSC